MNREKFVRVLRATIADALGVIDSFAHRGAHSGVSMSSTIFEITTLLAFVGIVAAAVGVFGVYLLHLPETIAGLAAWLCVEYGSCDLTANLLSIAVAVVILVGVGMILILPLREAGGPENIPAQPINEVKKVIKDAGEDGITPADVAYKADIDRLEVDRILAVLFDDGLVNCFKNTSGRLVYTWEKKPDGRAIPKLDRDISKS